MVVPQPVPVSVSNYEMCSAANAARARCAYRYYDQRQDEWGRGLTLPIEAAADGEPLSQAESGVYIGIIAEIAAASFLSWSLALPIAPNLSLMPRGDGGIDIDVLGVTMDVKGSLRGIPLVKSTDRFGRKEPLQSRVYVFGHVLGGGGNVNLMGWMTALTIERLPSVPALKGTHLNYDITPDMLESMDNLIFVLKAPELLRLSFLL